MNLKQLQDAHHTANEIQRQKNILHHIKNIASPVINLSLYEHGAVSLSKEDLLIGIRNRISEREKELKELGVTID
jgi:hypothetical protein